MLRREDFFFFAFVCFCKPLRAKQKATKVTKGEKTLKASTKTMSKACCGAFLNW
jgi:hypothetical protein